MTESLLYLCGCGIVVQGLLEPDDFGGDRCRVGGPDRIGDVVVVAPH